MAGQRLFVIAGTYAVCRLPPDAALPAWASRPGGFASVTRTPEELSIICQESHVPAPRRGGPTSEGGFALLKVQGPFPLDVVGVMASVAGPLAAAGVSLLALGTFDTDYLLVKRAQLGRALAALVEAGHTLVEE